MWHPIMTESHLIRKSAGSDYRLKYTTTELLFISISLTLSDKGGVCGILSDGAVVFVNTCIQDTSINKSAVLIFPIFNSYVSRGLMWTFVFKHRYFIIGARKMNFLKDLYCTINILSFREPNHNPNFPVTGLDKFITTRDNLLPYPA